MYSILVIFGLCLSTTAFASSKFAKDKRISNGYPATRYQFPYIASYQYLGDHFCGCVIISQDWLLTAAHCVDHAKILPLVNLRIVAGIINLSTAAPYKQVKNVLRQYRHPNYAGGITPDDIGLIRVVTSFQWTTDVGYIRLPNPIGEFYGITQIAGWGYLRSSYPVPTSYLQYANTNIITTSDCNAIVNRYGASVDYRSICVIGYMYGNETSCEGDTGGPLIGYGQNGNDILIGIMSWNLSPCGIYGMPSVSVKVSKYIGWMSCRIYMDTLFPAAICQ